MVTISSHDRRMGEDDAMSAKITPEFVKRRAAHLKLLAPLEDLVRELAPLPVSYDVTRMQPPPFGEFTYTEMLGAFYVCPQSSEIAARVVQAAVDEPFVEELERFDAAAAVLDRAQHDKYRLEDVKGSQFVRRVMFAPGSNNFSEMVSKEKLVWAMERYPDMMVKPHPMTNEGTLRQLGMLIGYHRIIDPMESGWHYLVRAEDVHVTTATEMGLYATLLNKRIHNMSAIKHEAKGVYAPFYRLLWDLPAGEANATLRLALNSASCGFVHPADPCVREKLTRAFELAMKLREPFKPLCHEYDSGEYALMLRGPAPERKTVNALRPGDERQEQRDPAVAA
jgi:hypothetical protein